MSTGLHRLESINAGMLNTVSDGDLHYTVAAPCCEVRKVLDVLSLRDGPEVWALAVVRRMYNLFDESDRQLRLSVFAGRPSGHRLSCKDLTRDLIAVAFEVAWTDLHLGSL